MTERRERDAQAARGGWRGTAGEPEEGEVGKRRDEK